MTLKICNVTNTNFLLKEDIRVNHILNIAKAVQLNNRISPTLFNTERKGESRLNSCRFSCEVWKQLNSGRLNNA